MNSWEKLNLKHKPLIDNALRNHPLLLSDYPFTNLWMWDGLRKYEIKELQNHLCIRFQESNHSIYLYPIGPNSPKPVIEALQAEETGPFKMRAIPEVALPEFPSPLKAEEDRFDYIYLYEDLLHLKGNKFQAKRNLIYQFENHYDFSYEKITPEIIPLIKTFEENWFQKHKDKGHHIEWEYQAVNRALDAFFELNVEGGALLVDKKVVAFSFAELISPNMWLIHAEKAEEHVKGAYQTINQQLLAHLKQVEYVNREESLGIDYLVKVKNSYHPVKILKKFVYSS